MTAVAFSALIAIGSLLSAPHPALAEPSATVAGSRVLDAVVIRSATVSAPSHGLAFPEGTAAPALAMPHASGPDADGRVTTLLTDGDLTMRVEVTARALGRSDYAVWLARPDGQPYPNVSRVAFKFAMVGMDHGLFSQEGVAGEDGRYAAQGNDLIMEGAWYGWVLVELADGTLRDGHYAFTTGPARPSRIAGRVESGAPLGQHLVNIAVYTDQSPPPGHIETGDAPTLLEVVMAQSAACSGTVRAPVLGLEATFTDHGLAQLRLPPGASTPLEIRCTEREPVQR